MNKSIVQMKKEMAARESEAFEEICDKYDPDSPTYMFKEGQ